MRFSGVHTASLHKHFVLGSTSVTTGVWYPYTDLFPGLGLERRVLRHVAHDVEPDGVAVLCVFQVRILLDQRRDVVADFFFDLMTSSV